MMFRTIVFFMAVFFQSVESAYALEYSADAGIGVHTPIIQQRYC